MNGFGENGGRTNGDGKAGELLSHAVGLLAIGKTDAATRCINRAIEELDAPRELDAELGLNARDSLDLAAHTMNGIEGIVGAMRECPNDIDNDMLQIVIDAARLAREQVGRASAYLAEMV